MKTVCVAGRVGKEAQLRRTPNGDPVLSFSVAVDDGYGQNKRTMWFDCSVWGKRAEALESHISKGTALTVMGDLSTREHEGKTYLTVRANEITLQGGRPERSGISETVAKSPSRPLAEELDDTIPF